VSSNNCWQEYVDALRSMRLARVRLDEGEYDDEIRSALAPGTHYSEALFLLSTGPPERLTPFLDLLVRRIIEQGREMEHLRQLLARVQPATLEPHLSSVVVETIEFGERVWDRFRPLAELLRDLGSNALLSRLVDYSARSGNADIREVAEDFGEHN
jgi:hypothetical protein